MLERRRRGRRYDAVPGEDVDDVELGEGGAVVQAAQEEGIVSTVEEGRTITLEEEVDNWDENAVDAWDEDDDQGDIGASVTKPVAAEFNTGGSDIDDAKKRTD
jgi:hypothetical protein